MGDVMWHSATPGSSHLAPATGTGLGEPFSFPLQVRWMMVPAGSLATSLHGCDSTPPMLTSKGGL